MDNAKECLGDCLNCSNQPDESARLFCAVFQGVKQNKIISKRLMEMEAKFEKITEDITKVYNAVSPHIEAIDDPELNAFCTMYENTLQADKADNLEDIEEAKTELNDSE